MKRKKNNKKKLKEELNKQIAEEKKEERIVYLFIAILALFGLLVCFLMYREMWDLK